jgi:hypothetical protein
MTFLLPLIPAKAGIQKGWVPAFAWTSAWRLR